MMDNIKKYCNTHHFYYRGQECPFCASERFQALSKKYVKNKTKKENKNDEKRVTMSDLERLKNKYNKKK